MIRKRSLTHLMLQFQSIRLTNPSISKTFFRSTPNPHCRWFSSSVFLNQSRLFVQHYCPWILSSSGTRCGFTGFRGMATRSMTDSSNRPPKETILLDGCDFEHWLVVTDPPDPNLTRDEIIDGYIKTLAKVVGSEEEARMKIYSVSTKHYFAFGALVSEELSYKLKELPGIRWVLPDSYLDVPNKSYGGEPFIDGRAVPYDPKYHEEWVRNHNQSLRNNAKQRDKRRSDRVSRREMTGNTSMPAPPPPPAPQAAYPASPPPSTPSPFSSQNIATTYGSTSQPSPSSRFPSAPQASNLVSPAAPSGGINQSMETAPGYQNQQPGIQNKSFPHTNQGWNISAPAQSHELSGGNGSYPNQGMPPPFTNRNYLGQDMPPPTPQNRNYPSQGMAPPPPQNRSYPSQDMLPPPPLLNRDCPSQGMTPPPPPPQNRSYPSQGMPPPPPPNRSFPSQGMPPPPPPPQRNYQSQGMPPPPPQRNYLNQGIPPPPLQNTNYPSQDMPSPVHNRNYPDQNMPPPSPPPPQCWNSPPTMQNQHFQNRDVPQQNYYNRGSPPPFQNHGNQPAGFPNRDFRSQEMGGFRGNESESRPTLDEDYNAVAK